MRRIRVTLLITVALLAISISGIPSISSWSTSDSLQTGPYVDEVIYNVISNQDQRVLALQSGEIEMDISTFDSDYYNILSADPDIDIYSAITNGYGQITINCQEYPLNISGLRRAFAFAYDKTRVTVEIRDGFSIEHDSVVPQTSGWCIENEFDWNYYTNQSDIGNQILDDLGFEINDSTGYRVAPNGEAFDIEIKYSSYSTEIAVDCTQIGVDALHALHIDALAVAEDYPTIGNGDYDMAFYVIDHFENDVEWLAYEYWSENADDYYQNVARFENETYDNWRDQLINGTTYEEVYEASAEMQKILHYNVPRLVVYEDTYLQAYRNDVFEGHVDDLGRYISGLWTMRNIHKLDGSFGGTVNVAIYQDPDSFNIFVTHSLCSREILSEIWPSLYKYGPDMTPWSDLAQSMWTETHSDNPAVPVGHTRFTFDIVQNATWSDGEPLTAEDVVFSFIYALESREYGNYVIRDIVDLAAAYTPTTYRAVIEFNTKSYWHFNNLAFNYIIPEHIFNNDTGIGYDGWNTWNPVFDSAEPNVNCGPFIFSDYHAREFYRISRNPLFHYAIDPSNPNSITGTNTTTTTSTTTTTNQTSIPLLNWSFAVNIVIATGAGIVIIYCTVNIVQTRKNRENN